MGFDKKIIIFKKKQTKKSIIAVNFFRIPLPAGIINNRLFFQRSGLSKAQSLIYNSFRNFYTRLSVPLIFSWVVQYTSSKVINTTSIKMLLLAKIEILKKLFVLFTLIELCYINTDFT